MQLVSIGLLTLHLVGYLLKDAWYHEHKINLILYQFFEI